MIHSFFVGKQLLYLDPGSGSFIIQMLLAGILGAGVAVRIYWKKIKKLFVKETDQKPVDETPAEDENGQK
ncbi:MAG: hypothetical protein LWX83_09535 [Anaerolineae bacterium]|nr:hypothetical protein [Anaerolineae bacterium]